MNSTNLPTNTQMWNMNKFSEIFHVKFDESFLEEVTKKTKQNTNQAHILALLPTEYKPNHTNMSELLQNLNTNAVCCCILMISKRKKKTHLCTIIVPYTLP